MDFTETHTTCKSYIWFRSLSSAISICTSQILLIYRGKLKYLINSKNQMFHHILPALAFYNWNSILQLSLWALFLATNISIFVLLVRGVSHYTVIPNPAPSSNRILGGCITMSYPKALAYVWQEIFFIDELPLC